ncbi:hypothetical protein [Chondromyces crocatus]|nr:hypothetical protein [Chondromyces crocatus]
MTRVDRMMAVMGASLWLFVAAGSSVAGCSQKESRPKGREADPTRDKECRDPSRPRAYFYPAEDRTHYAPDDPRKDGCELLVADHLFCCPAGTPETQTP